MSGKRHKLTTQVNKVPDEPGVYLWKDSAGEVLYVGKAKSLRKRMKQYVMGHDDRHQIPALMAAADSFDFVVTRNDSEALILEISFITELNPPFNVALKDDKSFPYIALTVSDEFPAIKFTREKRREGVRYFGPYTDSRAARSIIETVRRILPICHYSCPEWKKIARTKRKDGEAPHCARPCFDSHIGLGPGVCAGEISPQDYRKRIEKVAHFLTGDHKEVENTLRRDMIKASDNLDFESALRYRNRLDALKILGQKQTIVSDTRINLDAMGVYREETIACAYVLVVRGGSIINSNEFILQQGLDASYDEIISAFLKRYYHQSSEIPPKILIPQMFDEGDLVQKWLTDLKTKSVGRNRTVKLVVPKKGLKHELVEMANRNAKHALMRFMSRTHYEDDRLNTALLQLESALSLNSPPYRIECYDISTLHGSHSTASMVVFESGKKNLKSYRRFKIRLETDEANDVAMMKEVLRRRLAPDRLADERFGRVPDLIVIDGGKPQLNAARSVLAELELNIDVVGLAKRDEEVWVTWDDVPVVLPDGAPSLYLMKRVRDEAHRFAITYHRNLRSKAMTASILDEIPGIGHVKKKDLLKHFGSVKKLRAAHADEIAEVTGINDKLALDVYEFFVSLD